MSGKWEPHSQTSLSVTSQLHFEPFPPTNDEPSSGESSRGFPTTRSEPIWACHGPLSPLSFIGPGVHLPRA